MKNFTLNLSFTRIFFVGIIALVFALDDQFSTYAVKAFCVLVIFLFVCVKRKKTDA